ncbi:hypothetical protein F503_01336 [Ophiostoma piceae UAMH 11346]|uniref:Uncharacterized protein n=1 Tax=Ophiostoma piceae (strain UAMH 11346) TaxID=1262450 RepID=S3BV07_OPHP1|nr:hypothetical protein F503_01336 [Ophiostoma piceae UAMH 11346]
MDKRLDSMTTVRRWRFLQRYPCMDDELMDVTTTPPVTVRNLAVPRLRKCPFDLNTIDWQRARNLGAGTDGCVYRVYFGDQGPFALKLFWISDLNPGYPTYSAFHRECQNAALLQMLRASVDQAAAAAAALAAGGTPDGPTVPPLVDPNPMDFLAASDNLFSFAEDVRRVHENQPPLPELVPVTSMPRFAQCYGWLPCKVHELMDKMPRRIRSYGFHARHEAATEAEERASETERTEQARQAAKAAKDAKDRERVSAVADFLWLAGFDFCCQPLARNWKNGVLVDHSEIIGPYSPYWQRGPRNTKWERKRDGYGDGGHQGPRWRLAQALALGGGAAVLPVVLPIYIEADEEGEVKTDIVEAGAAMRPLRPGAFGKHKKVNRKKERDENTQYGGVSKLSVFHTSTSVARVAKMGPKRAGTG